MTRMRELDDSEGSDDVDPERLTRSERDDSESAKGVKGRFWTTQRADVHKRGSMECGCALGGAAEGEWRPG